VGFSTKPKHELEAVGPAPLFFGVWISALIFLWPLVLEEYHSGFSGWTKETAGALTLGKVALSFEHVSFGARVRARRTWVDTLVRTVLYSLGVAATTVIEHGPSGRREYGGFLAALSAENARGEVSACVGEQDLSFQRAPDL
jgi:hypothetical protein